MIEQVLAGVRRWWIEEGDSLEIMRSLPDACVDAVIGDPPHHVGQEWKSWFVPFMEEQRRIIKPGGFHATWTKPHYDSFPGIVTLDRVQTLPGSKDPRQRRVPYLVEKIEENLMPGCVVLDPFVGSGSTVIAALLTGMRAIGIEIRPDRVQNARKRVLEETERRSCE